jgi:hypothetical protein
MPELEADTYDLHPFYLTKIWPLKDYRLLMSMFWSLIEILKTTMQKLIN